MSGFFVIPLPHPHQYTHTQNHCTPDSDPPHKSHHCSDYHPNTLRTDNFLLHKECIFYTACQSQHNQGSHWQLNTACNHTDLLPKNNIHAGGRHHTQHNHHCWYTPGNRTNYQDNEKDRDNHVHS